MMTKMNLTLLLRMLPLCLLVSCSHCETRVVDVTFRIVNQTAYEVEILHMGSPPKPINIPPYKTYEYIKGVGAPHNGRLNSTNFRFQLYGNIKGPELKYKDLNTGRVLCYEVTKNKEPSSYLDNKKWPIYQVFDMSRHKFEEPTERTYTVTLTITDADVAQASEEQCSSNS